jgi:tryptophan-rich sensory protein
LPILGLFGWLAVTFVAAVVGALGSTEAASFYAQLNRPSWAPPAFWFGPVWSVLYVLMAVAAWLVWRSQAAGDMAPLSVLLQLVF